MLRRDFMKLTGLALAAPLLEAQADAQTPHCQPGVGEPTRTAEVLHGDRWVPRGFKELRKGDVFRLREGVDWKGGHAGDLTDGGEIMVAMTDAQRPPRDTQLDYARRGSLAPWEITVEEWGAFGRQLTAPADAWLRERGVDQVVLTTSGDGRLLIIAEGRHDSEVFDWFAAAWPTIPHDVAQGGGRGRDRTWGSQPTLAGLLVPASDATLHVVIWWAAPAGVA